MCYNSSSSITNYVYVTLLSIIMYLYGDKYDKHISLFAFIVVQMQLAEYFMWKDQKCGITNKIATIAARVILFLQPLGILLGSYLFNTMTYPQSSTGVLYILGLYTTRILHPLLQTDHYFTSMCIRLVGLCSKVFLNS